LLNPSWDGHINWIWGSGNNSYKFCHGFSSLLFMKLNWNTKGWSIRKTHKWNFSLWDKGFNFNYSFFMFLTSQSSCPFSAISQKAYERKTRRRIEVGSVIDKYSSQFARWAMFRLLIVSSFFTCRSMWYLHRLKYYTLPLDYLSHQF